jgi:GNAT superfamily N-acetyltransferase
LQEGEEKLNAPSSKTQPGIAIRAARAADYARIAELAGQLSYQASAEDIARRMRGMQDSAEHAVFVAESAEGGVVGWIGLCILHMIEADARVEVTGLIVDQQTRSKGVGQLLLDRGEAWAREKGCGEIGLRTNVIRERAHAFYERQGYKHVKTQRSYRKNL